MAWRWIERQLLTLLHDENLAIHGGASGLRDEGLLDSALARPQNLAARASPDLAALSASYATGVSQNQPFMDGNGRTALLALGLCLGLNGHRLTAPQGEAAAAIFGLASGDIDEDTFAAWLRERIVAR